MVSSDDNLVCMRLTTKPCVEVDDLARRVPIGHEISRMDQDVAIGNAESSVLSVRVADTDDSHSCHRREPLQSATSTSSSRYAVTFAFITPRPAAPELLDRVACPAPLPDLTQILLLHQLLNMHFDGVAVCAARVLNFLDGDFATRLCQLQYLAGKGGQG
jgi:hypothetical protein